MNRDIQPNQNAGNKGQKASKDTNGARPNVGDQEDKRYAKPEQKDQKKLSDADSRDTERKFDVERDDSETKDDKGVFTPARQLSAGTTRGTGRIDDKKSSKQNQGDDRSTGSQSGASKH